jgi:Zn finger protein HypA/HybF involved in hydrogenase expression
MHDLHEADKILKLVLEHAKRNKLKSVTKIVVGLGSVIEHGLEIDPENLKFNIGMLARGTLAEKAEVVVEKISGATWKLEEIEGER